MKHLLITALGLTMLTACARAQNAATFAKTTWKFSFGDAATAGVSGAIWVAPATKYAPARGYGFEPIGATPVANAGGVAAAQPFLFSAAVPEGNYRVRVVLGDNSGASNVTVKAESKRLMLEAIPVAAGATVTREFTVNVHGVQIAGGETVKLKPNEDKKLHWDDKLTLEFNGARPAVSSVEIVPETDATTVFLAGDSTVTDQSGEPYASWGQMLPRFFGPGVAVFNLAESGLSLGSFRAQNRLKKITSLAKAGDFVFVQFGHNDQKEKGENDGPFKSYQENLRDYLKQIRATGATPVLVSPVERRRWSGGKPQATLADYAESVRQVAAEEKVAFINLNAQSLIFYAALGEDNSKKAFAYAAANEFVGQSAAVKDDTHFSNYGAYELARVVVEGIKTNVPTLAMRLNEIAPFDAATPDASASFAVPFSAYETIAEKPVGS